MIESENPFFKTQEETLDGFLVYSIKDNEHRAVAVRALLDRFRTVERVLSADGETLASMPEVGRNAAVFLKLISAIQTRTHTETVIPGNRYTDTELADTLVALLSPEPVECVYMAMTDSTGVLLGVECVARGSVNSSNVTVRRFLEIATRKHASSVIIAHNHPSGLPRPSKEDICTTATLINAFSSVGITLTEHYVVADGRAEGICGTAGNVLTEERRYCFANPDPSETKK